MKFQKRNVITTVIHSYVIKDITKDRLVLVPIKMGMMSNIIIPRHKNTFRGYIDVDQSRMNVNKVYPLRINKDMMKKVKSLIFESMPCFYIPLTQNRYKDFYKLCHQHDYRDKLIVKFICNTEHLYVRVLTYKHIVRNKIPTLGLALEIL